MDTYEIWQRSWDPVFEAFGPYHKVYGGSVEVDPANPHKALDALFEKFNVAPPRDFRAHSLSVRDRVVLGERTFECAPIGWAPVEHPSEAPPVAATYFM